MDVLVLIIVKIVWVIIKVQFNIFLVLFILLLLEVLLPFDLEGCEIFVDLPVLHISEERQKAVIFPFFLVILLYTLSVDDIVSFPESYFFEYFADYFLCLVVLNIIFLVKIDIMKRFHVLKERELFTLVILFATLLVLCPLIIAHITDDLVEFRVELFALDFKYFDIFVSILNKF